MQYISDIILIIAAVSASIYCTILSKRLKNFGSLEKGVGGAVSILSAKVEDLQRTLQSAQLSAENSAQKLHNLVEKAEQSSRRIEIQTAALHDLPDLPSGLSTTPPKFTLQETELPSDPIFTRRHRVEAAQ